MPNALSYRCMGRHRIEAGAVTSQSSLDSVNSWSSLGKAAQKHGVVSWVQARIGNRSVKNEMQRRLTRQLLLCVHQRNVSSLSVRM